MAASIMGYIDVSVMAPRAVFVMNFLIIASSPNSILNFRGALIDSLISKGYTVHIAVPEIFVGGILGSMTVFFFFSWSIRAVGNAAEDVIREVRR